MAEVGGEVHATDSAWDARACQARGAWGAVDLAPGRRNIEGMAPVPKTRRPKQKTFLREWRLYRNLSQEKAAERLEIDRTTLSRIERGLVPYNQGLLESAAEAYSCEVVDLIIRNPTDPEAPWSIWETLKPAQRHTAFELIKTLKRASEDAA